MHDDTNHWSPATGLPESLSQLATGAPRWGWRAGTCAMVHKGIRFTVERATGSEVWIWEYKIGFRTKTGRLNFYPREVAIRRIRQKIDRDLREEYLQQRANISG